MMRTFPFATRKSAGVRVTAAVHRLIRQGDAARDARDWGQATAAYRAALAADPQLHHIRIQLGHALREAGAAAEADEAYAEAARLRPEDAEPVIRRAHLARRRRGPGPAIDLLADALDRGDRAGEAERELRDLLDVVPSISTQSLRALLAERAADEPTPSAPAFGVRPLVLDLTDLVGHFRFQRLPSGIQRVQIEVLAGARRSGGTGGIALGCFLSGRDDMIAIPMQPFLALVDLAVAGREIEDPAWQEARTRFFLRLARAAPLRLPESAILLNLGTSLWVGDYFRFLRNAKAQARISYVPFVHDLIPMTVPHFCVPGIRREFAAWLAGLFQHADGFLANSRSTAHDLRRAADRLGHIVREDRVEVVPLDADFRPEVAPLPEAALEHWGLGDAPFALLVSTIEPRKGHEVALDAWAALIRTHGAAAVPRLVCVGRNGWMNDHVFGRLAADPALIAHVTIIHDVSDAELALLYRACAFTLYPSHYEGWGLPVTEALCHGKVPIVADNSSLPEAGAGFALLFDSGSADALARAVERVAFDPAWRAAQEARIRAEFRPRAWATIASHLVDAARRLAGPVADAPPAAAMRRGVFYPVGLHDAPQIWPGLVSGEIFRVGNGWLWAEPEGCRTTPEGGRLQMRLADSGGEPRLYMRLQGLAARDCAVAIASGGQEVRAVVPAATSLWVACDVAVDSEATVSVTIHGDASEEVTLRIGGRERSYRASIAVTGLFFGDASSENADRQALATIDGWRGPR